MGASISQIRENAQNLETHKRIEVEQQLNILEKIVDSKLEKEKLHIFLAGKNGPIIHTGMVVDVLKFVNIIIGEINDITTSVEMVIDSYFSEVNKKKLSLLIYNSLSAIIEQTSEGEHEAKDMLILEAKPIFLRCDAYHYRWNFVANSMGHISGVCGVLLVKRVIDRQKTIHQVLKQHISDKIKRAIEWDQQTKPEVSIIIYIFINIIYNYYI